MSPWTRIASNAALTLLILLAFATTAEAQCPEAAFATGSTVIETGNFSNSIAAGDLNGDGITDLVVAGPGGDPFSSGFAVLLARPAGGFEPAAFTALGASLLVAQIADLNGDGKLDVVLSDYIGGGVWVVLGSGDGTLQPAVKYGTLGGTVGLLIADLNGDGLLDVAVADAGNGSVDVLLGNGDGTLQAAAAYPAGGDTWAIAAGDFNGDGKPDLVAVNTQSSEATVLVNDGSGGFSNSDSFLVAASPVDVKVFDADEDGHSDLVVSGVSHVQIWSGDGAGNFSLTSTIPTPETFSASGATVAQLDGDSHADLAVGDALGRILLFHGDGHGHFAGATTIVTEDYVGPPTFADVNGDGLADMIFGGGSLAGIVVLPRISAASFPSGTPFYPVDSALFSAPLSDTLGLGDFNGDGVPDLAFATYGGVALAEGDGSGGFAAATSPAGNTQIFSLAIGDFDGDGNSDLAGVVLGGVEILLGDGAGGLSLAGSVSTSCCSLSIAVADFDGDGLADVVAVDPTQGLAYVSLGDGTGNLAPATPYLAGTYPIVVRARDLNGDGIPDLVVVDQGTARVGVLLGAGDGTFGVTHFYPVHDTAFGGLISLAVEDLNGDDRPDLVVGVSRASNQIGIVSVLLNLGNGQFGPPVDLPLGLGSQPTAVGVGDFNGDGEPDIAATDYNSGVVWAFVGAGDGSFSPGTVFLAGGTPYALLTGDFNGDGKTDIVTTWPNGALTGFSVLLNDCVVPTVSAISPSSGPSAGGTIVTITGTLFQPGALVTIGGAAASGVAFVNSTTLTAVTPPHAAGTVDVTVVNPGSGSGTFHNGFTFVPSPAPHVSTIAPSSGPAAGGTTITVAGTGFQIAATLAIGGFLASGITVPSDLTIEGVTPGLSPGSLNDVVVTNPDTQSATLVQAYLADFLDVAQADIFHDAVEKIFRGGFTAGCGGGNYCRSNPVTRAQMAVFLLKAEHGSSYVPPACTGIFPDVACPSAFANWVERLHAEGITGGCGGGNYCPTSPVTRQQMAVFLLKTEHGSSYAPPACLGVFADVACPGAFADWIEQLYAEGVTGGCQTSPLLYCPTSAVTRGQMSVFLVKTFSLP